MLDDLNNLAAAERIQAPNGWRPAVEFDGEQGTATTAGLSGTPNFDDFLREVGYDPEHYEVIGNSVRTSKWQKYDGDWLTSYRFHFRLKTNTVNLPLLWAQAKKTKPKKTALEGLKPRALVILFSDLQIGKTDHRGGTEALLMRVESVKAQLVALVKKQKPQKIVFCDVGDIIESFSNTADMMQLQSNDLSLMGQVDLAATIVWDFLKALQPLTQEIIYATIGSNHCQNRVKGQRVGLLTDDWGVHIGRQLARLSREVGLGIKFIEPQPHDESLAHDVFGDGSHILGLVHGHQANRPDGVPEWWRKQAFGRQPVAGATVLASGHFHHLQVRELGSTPTGGSRFWIQAATLDNGSGWFRLNSGEDSQPGLVCFELVQGQDFGGTVHKLMAEK